MAFMLTVLQKKLLALMARNCRYSNKDVAKILAVSPDTVEYQINNVLSLGNFSTLFDYYGFGFVDNHLLIRVKDIEQMPLKELSKFSEISFINTCQGKYDIQLIFLSKDASETESVQNKIINEFGDNLQDFLLLKAHPFLKYTNILPIYDEKTTLPSAIKKKTYLLSKKFLSSEKTSLTELDATDIKILEQLIKDARKSYLQIAKAIGTTRDIVQSRIDKFMRNNFIRSFCFKPNHKKFGYYSNFILIKFRTVENSVLKTYFESKKEIFYAGLMEGEYNCIIYLVSKDPKEFTKIVKDLRVFFKDNILDLDLFYFDELIKERQFPAIELIKRK